MIFSSQQPKAKESRRHCCNVLFSHVRQQLTNKMKEDHQEAIEEKDSALALLTDNLQGRDNQIQAIQMRTLHCKHKEMFIRPSYKDVKTPLPILEKVM